MVLRSVGTILSLALTAQAFAPVARFPLSRSFSPLFVGPETTSEEDLRQEIARRNSEVENEGQYAVADGEGIATLLEEADAEQSSEFTSSDSSSSAQSLKDKMDRMTEQRAYPLFLAEKAAEIVELSMGDLTKFLASDDEVESLPVKGKKEKVVILGTGWGSAAFLKGVNADLYDVTVISPRNYFLFTPMLAGSSVGTVEYRSITEPVREVSY